MKEEYRRLSDSFLRRPCHMVTYHDHPACRCMKQQCSHPLILTSASGILTAKTFAFMATSIKIGATDSPPRVQQNRAAFVQLCKTDDWPWYWDHLEI